MCFIFMTYSYVTNNLSSDETSTIPLHGHSLLKSEYGANWTAKHKNRRGYPSVSV